MPYAYIVAQVDVKDAAAYEEYRAQVPATISQYGGEYLARGGQVEVLEGEPPLGRVVILRFASLEQAKAWYHSPEYAGPLAIRHRAAVSRSMLVEGME
ncbi:D-fructose-6-phosphate amidotransferase [alpha proteobacterium BAL199]|jgi:uncharacterized protein (DUF1330 family)|nr:D-fructose-6-phosphate amidotransferase [alpha proteobacterium BAL199]